MLRVHAARPDDIWAWLMAAGVRRWHNAGSTSEVLPSIDSTLSQYCILADCPLWGSSYVTAIHNNLRTSPGKNTGSMSGQRLNNLSLKTAHSTPSVFPSLFYFISSSSAHLSTWKSYVIGLNHGMENRWILINWSMINNYNLILYKNVHRPEMLNLQNTELV